ncbi:MAG: bifunctional 4-hydroxy-2-oxoglutarate aldolase/2-dehydro-3-deoxy-phosphogluconate aldolase [Verrucomicrobiota bacterium]|jgi:2-dehydro-3-deoxyphosphogluconate aldolase/(4S)-4-hydroxy-2-oxoglutarate aldolase
MISPPFPDTLLARIHQAAVIATLMIDDANDAVPLARALSDGGVHCIELTLRTRAALEALRRIREEMPQVTIGVGTILTPQLVHDSVNAGAAFGVAPGMNPRVVAEARQAGLPFAPGVCTPSDIEHALEAGCTLMKFFPCEPCGGLPYLRSINAPFAHLNVQFIPLGGIDLSNAERYLKEPFIPAIGGSWIATRELVQQRNWTAITKNAQQAMELVNRVRGGAL